MNGRATSRSYSPGGREGPATAAPAVARGVEPVNGCARSDAGRPACDAAAMNSAAQTPAALRRPVSNREHLHHSDEELGLTAEKVVEAALEVSGKA